MSTPTVYVIRNQAGLFLNKQLEWIPAGEPQTLYRCAHRDEAVNTVFEVSAKDIYLRAEAIACGVDTKGQPVLPDGDQPAAPDSDAPPVAVAETATADTEPAPCL